MQYICMYLRLNLDYFLENFTFCQRFLNFQSWIMTISFKKSDDFNYFYKKGQTFLKIPFIQNCTDIRNSRVHVTVYRWDIFCSKISAKIWSWERRSKISIALKLSLVLDGGAALALLLLLRTKARWRGVRLPMMIISGIFMQHRLGFGPAKGPVSCCLKSPFRIWISGYA